MKIPLFDLRRMNQPLLSEFRELIDHVVENSDFISGPAVDKFEKNFSNFCNAKFGVGTSSGTSALHLSLLACNITCGDEVITTPHTFIATAEAISIVGARPVFIDIDPKTYNINPQLIESAITEKTKAILPVHIYGQAADMNAINEIAKKYSLKVIEDAAQAHGASHYGIRVGGLSDVACFSFYPGKNLGAFGDAGILVTNNDNINRFTREFRDHGRSEKYIHKSLGFNHRLDTLQAAILDIKLEYLEEWTKKRKEIARAYEELLQNVPVGLPFVHKYNDHAYHLYVIRVKQRDKLKNFLNERGIGASVHYPIPLHLQPAYKDLGYKENSLIEAELAAKEVLSLPIYPGMRLDEIDYISKAIQEFYCK